MSTVCSRKFETGNGSMVRVRASITNPSRIYSRVRFSLKQLNKHDLSSYQGEVSVLVLTPSPQDGLSIQTRLEKHVLVQRHDISEPV